MPVDRWPVAYSSRPYRSGLKFWPPLALGGHTWQVVDEGVTLDENEGGLFAVTEAPALYRCASCYLLLPRWAVDEGFYPRCVGAVRALPRARMAREEFERAYAGRSGISVEHGESLGIFPAVPCDCGEDLCEGWRRRYEDDE